MGSFREFINYEAPPEWARKVIEPVAAHFGKNIATGFNAAGERLGFNAAHSGRDRYANLNRMEDPSGKPRLNDNDRRSTEGQPDLRIIDKGNYWLIPATVPNQGDTKDAARSKILADQNIRAQANAQDIRLGKMIFPPSQAIVDPNTGQQIIRYIVKVPKH